MKAHNIALLSIATACSASAQSILGTWECRKQLPEQVQITTLVLRTNGLATQRIDYSPATTSRGITLKTTWRGSYSLTNSILTLTLTNADAYVMHIPPRNSTRTIILENDRFRFTGDDGQETEFRLKPEQGGGAYPPPAARLLQGKSRATDSGSAHP